MTLARKLGFKITLLLAALVAVGATSLWGLLGMSGHFDVAEDEYEQLRSIYEVGHYAAAARTLINLDAPNPAAARAELRKALQAADALGQSDSDSKLKTIVSHLQQALSETDVATGSLREALPRINQSLGQVASLAEQTKSLIIANRQAATGRLRTTISVMAIVGAVALLGAIVIGVSQYRSIVHPLARLEKGAANVAEAKFTERVEETGDREFARVAQQFNRMADELDELYRNLESQVRTKSQQLIRSERLAGVGYLAAGIAHEINNPLGIISGYAESALQRIQEEPEKSELTDRLKNALQIACDESFRCKEIIEKLLQLAGPGTGERLPVDGGQLVDRVAEMVGGLPQSGKRKISVDLDKGPLLVHANEAELTQVLVNLLRNAMEATDPESGVIDVRVRRRGEWIEITIADNGRGMNEELLSKLFEPFFTDKPARDERGTGLGLAVSHAIVEQHDGRLRADSDGPGKGSVFTMELPVHTHAEVTT